MIPFPLVRLQKTRANKIRHTYALFAYAYTHSLYLLVILYYLLDVMDHILRESIPKCI